VTGVGFTRPTFGMVLTPLVVLVTVDLDLRDFFITKNAITPAMTINTITPTTIPAIAAVSSPPILEQNIRLCYFHVIL